MQNRTQEISDEKKLRVALLCGPLPYTIALANGLSGIADTHVFVGSNYAQNYGKGVFEALLPSVRLHVHPDFRKRDPRRMISDIRLLLLLRRGGFDIIHLQFPGTLFMRLFWKIVVGSIPLVFTVHDPRQHSGGAFYRQIGEDLLQRFFVRQASAIIVHGQAMRRLFFECYGERDNVHSLMHGDLSFYKNIASGEMATPCNDLSPVILFFGNLRPDKGLDLLALVIPKVLNRRSDAQFVIVGSGDVSPLAAVSHLAQVKIVNEYVPHSEVDAYFRSASLLVLPYRDATQSGVIPVAYSYGIPVVATAVGGLIDVVVEGVTGMLTPANDPDAFADAVLKMLDDPERLKNMGRFAEDFCKAELSWDSIAVKTLSVYSNLVNDRLYYV